MKVITTCLRFAVLLGCFLAGQDLQAYYNPATGTWLSRDPIAERGGLNLYGFVANDAVNKWDYLGLADITLSHQRSSRDYFGTYGKLTVKVDNEKLKNGGCCNITPPSSFLTIELPPNAKNPAGYNEDGSVRRFYSGLFSSSSGKAYLRTPSDTSIQNIMRNPESYRPANLTDEDWQDLKKYAISTGIGAINIHLGRDSLSSGGCILIGTSYVPRGFKLPAGAIFPGLEADMGYPHVTSFADADSAKAQVDLTHFLWCAQKALGKKLDIDYRRTGAAIPPMAADPYNGNNLSAPDEPPTPEPAPPGRPRRPGWWPFPIR